MNEEIKAQWVAALRSGDYRQGTGFLRYKGAFCCLGVLCDLAVKAGTGVNVQLGTSFNPDAYRFDGKSAHLPDRVQEWAGVESTDPEVNGGEVYPMTLSELNDNGTPFAAIADLIEDQL